MFAKGVRIQALFDNDHALNIRYLAQPLGKFVICLQVCQTFYIWRAL